MENNQTKLKLAQSCKECMKYHPIDKITVTMIVSKANCTRQTFYRNFIDKYDLVNWYFEHLVMKSFKEMGLVSTLYDSLVKKLNFIKSEKFFFMQAFGSSDNNSLVEYDYKSILEFYTSIIETNTQCELTFENKFLLEMYCHGSISMTIDWVNSGMKETSEEVAKLLIDAMPSKLIPLLSNIKLK